jgi:hypothetical protein
VEACRLPTVKRSSVSQRDMVASPNGGYFVQVAKVTTRGNRTGGSATIARVLADQLVKTGVTSPDDQSDVRRRRRTTGVHLRLAPSPTSRHPQPSCADLGARPAQEAA